MLPQVSDGHPADDAESANDRDADRHVDGELLGEVDGLLGVDAVHEGYLSRCSVDVGVKTVTSRSKSILSTTSVCNNLEANTTFGIEHALDQTVAHMLAHESHGLRWR